MQSLSILDKRDGVVVAMISRLAPTVFLSTASDRSKGSAYQDSPGAWLVSRMGVTLLMVMVMDMGDGGQQGNRAGPTTAFIDMGSRLLLFYYG
jgi:hypothetical protein